MADNSLEGWISKQINNGRTRKDIASLLNEHGFKTEEGGPITTLDISRHLAGAENIVIPPNADLPAPARERPSPSEKIAALVEEIAPMIIDQDPGLREDLKDSEPEELEDITPIDPFQGEEEEFMDEPLEDPKPARVPAPKDHSRSEHAHVQELARVHAVFSPRAPVELEEDSRFFNIPSLKRKPVEVRTRPHEPKSFGANVLSTRDLNVRKRKPS
jgi:hypothetical protein